MTDGRLISTPYDPEDVIGVEPLWDSMEKCKNGVLWKGSVARAWLNGGETVCRLSSMLHDGTYKPKPLVHFTVTSPVVRNIVGTSFVDRVYQRSLNDNVVYPIMSRSWVYDNGACQTGKGTDFSRIRMKRHIERHYRKHDIGGGILSLDVKGYYSNMLHVLVNEMFERELPNWAFHMVKDILEHQYPGEIGYCPGSQIMQIAGVSFLSGIDHFVKEDLGIKGYVRYMDDLRIVHEDIGYLETCLEAVSSELNKIGLTLNDNKTRINLLTDNVPFLGFTYRLTSSGKVVMRPLQETLYRNKRKLRRLKRIEQAGNRPKGTTDESFRCFIDHVSKGDAYYLIEYFDKWYEKLCMDVCGGAADGGI